MPPRADLTYQQRVQSDRAFRIAVIGAGAIGGWIAARLAFAGSSVMAATSRGTLARLTVDQDDRSEIAELQQFDDAADLVVLAVKAPALAGALKSARPLIGSDTIILPMLNGVPWWFPDQQLASVDPDGSIAAALPMDRITGCVVHASCRRLASDHVQVVHADKLILGEPSGGTSPRIERLCALFEGASIRCEASDNIRRAIWYKLWGNATINPLSALTRANADQLLADASLRGFMSEAMDELAAIGAAIGCPISESAEDRMAVTARLGAFKTSMLQDVEAGRTIELEALVGAPLEIAQRHNIAAPQLERIYATTRLMAENLGLL